MKKVLSLSLIATAFLLGGISISVYGIDKVIKAPSGKIIISGNALSLPTWSSSKSYASGDIIRRGNTLYMAASNHTSTSDFGTDWITNSRWIAMTPPPGHVMPVAGPCPEGTFLANGASKSRTTYADLFKAIGTAHGYPDGSNFYLPDYRGRFLRGVDGGIGRDGDRGSRLASGASGNTGDAVGSYQTKATGATGGETDHTHLSLLCTGGGSGYPANAMAGIGCTTYYSSFIRGSTGHTHVATTAADESRPENINVNYCVKY